jgi:hypothetical protein
MGWDTYQVATGNPVSADIIKIAGSDFGRSQPIVTLLWSLTAGGADELLELFVASIAFAP